MNIDEANLLKENAISKAKSLRIWDMGIAVIGSFGKDIYSPNNRNREFRSNEKNLRISCVGIGLTIYVNNQIVFFALDHQEGLEIRIFREGTWIEYLKEISADVVAREDRRKIDVIKCNFDPLEEERDIK